MYGLPDFPVSVDATESMAVCDRVVVKPVVNAEIAAASGNAITATVVNGKRDLHVDGQLDSVVPGLFLGHSH